jgi:hypothetical protein
MTTLSIVPGEAAWRARAVRYYAGDWAEILTVLPEFSLVPFNAGEDEPANPFLQTVMRKPLTAAERPIPVGVVSNTYSLAPHRDVAMLCRKGLVDAGVEAAGLRYEVGVSELGEWMNFRIYMPESYSFTDVHGKKLDLRLECFNSVDGSSRLVILFGWFRFVCANGLVIGETKIEIKERHGQNLDLASIPERIRPAFEAVEADRRRMQRWQSEPVAVDDIASWADGGVTEKWGKRRRRGSSISAQRARILRSMIRSRLARPRRNQFVSCLACQAPRRRQPPSTMFLKHFRSLPPIEIIPKSG